MVSAREMVGILKRQELRCRTGVLSLASADLGTESEIAASLGIGILDCCERLKALAPPNSEYLDLALARLVEDLDNIANAKTGEICVMIANFDLALSRLRTEESQLLWQILLKDFPNKTRALVFCVPAHADGSYVFPDPGTLAQWRNSDRFAEWNQR